MTVRRTSGEPSTSADEAKVTCAMAGAHGVHYQSWRGSTPGTDMVSLTRAFRFAVLALGATATGCAGVTPVPYSQLASSTHLAPNPADSSGRMPYSYSTQVDWRSYNKVILEPVVIYRGPDHQFGDTSEQDREALASYMGTRFAERLRSRFHIVGNREPNTLRVRLTLTGAVLSTPVISTLSRVDVAGVVYNVAQASRDGEGSMTGSVIYAVEIFDASTSRLLRSFVSKQYPSPIDISATVGPLTASKAGIDKGANALMAQLK